LKAAVTKAVSLTHRLLAGAAAFLALPINPSNGNRQPLIRDENHSEIDAEGPSPRGKRAGQLENNRASKTRLPQC
jgi:hypothetical protein